MRDLTTLSHHKVSEEVVSILSEKTQNKDLLFFRIMVAYYFAKVASMLRVSIRTAERGNLPINVYAMNLATSGAGKGYSMNIMEDLVLSKFKKKFLDSTFNHVAESNLAKIAVERGSNKGTDPNEELVALEKEFELAGELAFSFDSATPAAMKQLRHKLLLANAGSLNLEIDEIGTNLLGNSDALGACLELYDVGKIKQKLTKNTNESVRSKEIDGSTPTNLLMLGTPSRLLNGGKTEEELNVMLDTGYARRCIFGYTKEVMKDSSLSPEALYDLLTAKGSSGYLNKLADKLELLADPVNFNREIIVDRDVGILWIEYRLHCEKLASELGEHEEIHKAELSHRYFKAMKIAGAYAFIDGSYQITKDLLYNAIALVEESGNAFTSILNRDRNYVRLAKYLATLGRDVTHVDLVEDLHFYKGTNQAKQEMLTLATAWGYQNNVIIKKTYIDGIEFLGGESLKETDLDKMIISHSPSPAYDYVPELAPFNQLHNLTQLPNHNWINHNTKGNHRTEENCIPGFNLVVIDVDGEVSLATAKLLLKNYKCLYHTTKRHTDKENRFHIIFPINYELKLDAKDFKQFMDNIYDWLPFDSDTGTGQRSRKWACHAGQYEYTDGEVLDCLPFIPKTSKNLERESKLLDQQSLTNLERWFIKSTGKGNRSNQLIKYALLLVDSGQNFDQVRNNVSILNNKLPDKLEEMELLNTILVSVNKRIKDRDTKAA